MVREGRRAITNNSLTCSVYVSSPPLETFLPVYRSTVSKIRAGYFHPRFALASLRDDNRELSNIKSSENIRSAYNVIIGDIVFAPNLTFVVNLRRTFDPIQRDHGRNVSDNG